jgi:hypothetical protein
MGTHIAWHEKWNQLATSSDNLTINVVIRMLLKLSSKSIYTYVEYS